MMSLLKRKSVVIGLIIIAVLFPLVTQNNYYIHIMTLSFIWIIAVYGLNLLAGYTGYLSLAHAGFFTIGAYALGLLTVKTELSFWPAFMLAPIITAVIGVVAGLISLRTKEHYFAIYTLCVGYVIYLIIDKWDGLTGGVRGLIGISGPSDIGPISFASPLSQYYLVLFFLLIVILIVYRIVHSIIGKTYIAIRNSEELAQTLGISTMKNKLIVFVLSTFFAGLAGALYASFIRFIGPELGYITTNFDLLMYLLVGGIGTLSGPIIGTILIVWLTQQLQFFQDYRMIIFGPLLTLLIIFSPRGIVGFLGDRKIRRIGKNRRKLNEKQKDSNMISESETKKQA